MVGSSADESSMRPTILVICPESKKRIVENGLADFVRITMPTNVEFKIATGNVRLSAGEIEIRHPTNEGHKKGDRTDLVVEVMLDERVHTLMGRLTRVQSDHQNKANYPLSTIGGTIRVGNSLYGLTVAHSMFRDATTTINPYWKGVGFRECGRVKYWEWSGNGDKSSQSVQSNLDLKGGAAMDWMLIELSETFYLPNIYRVFESDVPQQVAGYLTTSELSETDHELSLILGIEEQVNDEVFICAGISGTQTGILSFDISSIIFGEGVYDVLCLSLENPLGISSPSPLWQASLTVTAGGDSGSWVFKNGKVCGCIFARLEGLPWAYMLPMEPLIFFRANHKTSGRHPGCEDLQDHHGL
jgi:hypothetical protein